MIMLINHDLLKIVTSDIVLAAAHHDSCVSDALFLTTGSHTHCILTTSGTAESDSQLDCRDLARS